MRFGRGGGVVVQHRTLRSGSGAFDILPGWAGVAEQHDPGTRPGSDHQPSVHDEQPLVRSRLLLQRAGTDVPSDQVLTRPGGNHGHLQRCRPELVLHPVELPGGQLGGDVRAAEGPAAPQSEVEAEPMFVRPLCSEVQVA